MTQVGLVFAPRSPAQIVETIRVMEDCGFSFAGLLDTQALFMDVYVGLAIAAANSERIRLGPCVTNPNTRDLSVTASAISSVNLLAPGRAYLGISKGFSGTAAVGAETSKTTSLDHTVLQIRALTQGQALQVDGRSMQVQWSRERVPIYLAASGPKALNIAGRVADGAFVHMGHFPEVVENAFHYVREGAQEAGRNFDELDLWLYGAGDCNSDGDAAREGVMGVVAGMGTSVFTPSTKGKSLPPELEAPIAELKANYAINRHMQPGATTNEHLVERLGLSKYLLERFALVGTPKEVRAKKQALEAMGVKRILLNVTTSKNLPETVRYLADALEPQPN